MRVDDKRGVYGEGGIVDDEGVRVDGEGGRGDGEG